MKYLSYFNNFISEAINLPSDLNKNQFFQKVESIDVALLTFDEYLELVNPQNKWHDSYCYQHDLDDMNQSYTKDMSKLKLLQRKKVGNMDIMFYESNVKLQYGKHDENNVYRNYTDAEIKEKGLPTHEITIYAYHEGKRIGFVADEWGATLVTVANEYKGNGIGKMLTYYFRKKHPDRDSGGFTDAGLKNIKNVYREFVKEYLRNGIYSHLVKTGKLNANRAKEIITSANLQNYNPNKVTDYAKNYNVSELNDNLLFWRYTDSDFILFDKRILNIYKDGNNERMIEHYLKAHVYLSYNTLFDNYELYESYGISKKFEAILLQMSFETINKEENSGVIIRITQDLSPQTLEIIENFKTNGNFLVSKVNGHNYDIIKAKTFTDYTPLFNKARIFVNANDKHEEFSTFLAELAYRESNYNGIEEN